VMAVYGLGIMTPLGWGWALVVWGYALAWFLVSDRVKLLAYRFFDPAKIKTPSDLGLRIAKGAYALYEQHGRHDGHAAADWLQAEQKVGKGESSKQRTPTARQEGQKDDR